MGARILGLISTQCPFHLWSQAELPASCEMYHLRKAVLIVRAKYWWITYTAPISPSKMFSARYRHGAGSLHWISKTPAGSGWLRLVLNTPSSSWFGCYFHRVTAWECNLNKSISESQAGLAWDKPPVHLGPELAFCRRGNFNLTFIGVKSILGHLRCIWSGWVGEHPN